jgi:hypothetical protein
MVCCKAVRMLSRMEAVMGTKRMMRAGDIMEKRGRRIGQRLTVVAS